MLLTTLAGMVLASTWTSVPSGDVWVYPHAGNPGAEPLLRVWGDGEQALDSVHPASGDFSYAFLSWKVRGIRPDQKLKSAKLTIFVTTGEDLTAELMLQAPLEVFLVDGTLDEATFAYDKGLVKPLPESIGKSTARRAGDVWELTIPIMDAKGRFASALKQAVGGERPLTLALASKMAPASLSSIYRVHSKEATKEAFHPRMTLEFAE